MALLLLFSLLRGKASDFFETVLKNRVHPQRKETTFRTWLPEATIFLGWYPKWISSEKAFPLQLPPRVYCYHYSKQKWTCQERRS